MSATDPTVIPAHVVAAISNLAAAIVSMEDFDSDLDRAARTSRVERGIRLFIDVQLNGGDVEVRP